MEISYTVITSYKKESKNIVNNYQPIRLLPIFAKVVERLLTPYSFIFMKISYLQSVSLVFYQLIPVYHDFYSLYMKSSHLLIHHWKLERSS